MKGTGESKNEEHGAERETQRPAQVVMWRVELERRVRREWRHGSDEVE